MKEHRVLLDLSTIMSGQSYAGIPQDTRLIFKTFSQVERINLTGLICSLSPHEVTKVKLNQNDNKIAQALSYTDYFFKLEGNVFPSENTNMLAKLTNKFSHLHQMFICGLKLLKKNYIYHDCSKNYYDYVWRRAFNGFIDSSFKDLIVNQNFVLSDFNKSIFTQRILKNLPLSHLHTPGVDFAVFQSGLSQCPTVSKGTIPIIRYHDSVALRYPDTIADSRMSKVHAKGLLASYKHAYFVCNSEPVRDELLVLAPSLEKKTFVVPPSHSFENTPIEKNDRTLAAIFGARRSQYEKVKPEVIQECIEKPFNYIISVSTLEPRKNFLSLIRAWEKVRYLQDNNLKLVIVGSPGWKFEPIMHAMRQHVLNGNIIHLEKVPVYELATLYAHAQAFIFPTYYEGFGSTPIEAMHAKCPIVVSDTPTTRWVLGDAALYCDAYDISSIADTITRLLYAEGSAELRRDVINKGQKVIEKYTSQAVGEQWLNLFDQLKTKKV
jgi:glycosyltransferase involved in cell wall biosynthesis